MSPVPEISPADAWAAIQSDPDAVLVDVRTEAEWNFVGVPDLSPAGKRVALIPWQLYPSMAVNSQFAEMLHKAGVEPTNKVYFLCRSGARSLAAAQASAQAGYAHVFNVTDGFEGPVDHEGHRGTVGGWKASGLPWMQR